MILWLMFAHWVADFVCQTDKMALNKSKSLRALTSHSLAYAAIVYILAPVSFPMLFFSHLLIDGVTSKVNGLAVEEGQEALVLHINWVRPVLALRNSAHSFG